VVVEAMPKQEGRNMIMVISPNRRHLDGLAKQRAQETKVVGTAAASDEGR
jgi:hypothetical protein